MVPKLQVATFDKWTYPSERNQPSPLTPVDSYLFSYNKLFLNKIKLFQFETAFSSMARMLPKYLRNFPRASHLCGSQISNDNIFKFQRVK